MSFEVSACAIIWVDMIRCISISPFFSFFFKIYFPPSLLCTVVSTGMNCWMWLRSTQTYSGKPQLMSKVLLMLKWTIAFGVMSWICTLFLEGSRGNDRMMISYSSLERWYCLFPYFCVSINDCMSLYLMMHFLLAELSWAWCQWQFGGQLPLLCTQVGI